MPAPQSPASSAPRHLAPGRGLRSAPQHIGLLADTGLQFVDLEFSIDWTAAHGPAAEWGEGFFIASGHGAARELTRLLPAAGRERRYTDPVSGRTYAPSSAEYRYRITDALRLFNEVWLPLPYQTLRSDASLGPSDWARVRITEITAADDSAAAAGTVPAAQDARPQRSRYCITLVFDTRIERRTLHPGRLSPGPGDLDAGVSFTLQWQCPQATAFLRSGGCAQPWVSRWCQSAFTLLARERLYPNKGETAIGDAVRDRLEHEAHYLNLLALLGAVVHVPGVALRPGPGRGAVGVSVFIDLQPDRFSALFAEHPDAGAAAPVPAALHELGLRDLGTCEQMYAGPLPARAELCRAYFSPDASQGCPDHPEAFCWTSLVRTGPEAERLAEERDGTEGRTGMASPLQALSQEEEADCDWQFNPCSCQVSSARISRMLRDRREPAVLEAVNRHLTARGEALFAATALPHVLSTAPRYAGRAFMTLTLLELLLQAVVQVNGYAHRSRSPQPDCPRVLERVAVAVPPSMTAVDREQLRSCLHEAVGVLWKCLGYDGSDDLFHRCPDPGLPLPQVHADCDAGQCLQALYLHRELGQAAAERIGSLLQDLHGATRGEPHGARLASLIIGRQRTELTVYEYELRSQEDQVSALTARALLREGLAQGGGELEESLLAGCLLPAVAAQRSAGGTPAPDPSAAQTADEDVAAPAQPPSAAARRVLLQAARALLELPGRELQSGREVTLGELLDGGGGGRADDAARTAPADGGSQAPLLQARVRPEDACRAAEACLAPQQRWGEDLTRLLRTAAECGAQAALLSGCAASLPGLHALLQSVLGLPAERIITLQEPAVRGLPLCMPGAERHGWAQVKFVAAMMDAETSLRYFGLLDGTLRLPHEGVRYVYAPESAQQSGPRRTAYEEDGWRAVRYQEAGGTYEAVQGHDETFAVTLPALWGGRQLAAADGPAVPLYAIELLADPAAHPEVRRARQLPCPGPEVAIEDFVCQLAPELREDCRRRLQDVANDLKQLEARLIHERGILIKDLEQDASSYAMSEAVRARERRGLLQRIFQSDDSTELEERAAAEYVRIHTPERVEQVLERRRIRETRRLQLQRLACIRETLRSNIELLTRQCTQQLQLLQQLLEDQHGVVTISVELYRHAAAWQPLRAGGSGAAPRCRLGRAYCGSDGRDYSDFLIMRRLCAGTGAEARSGAGGTGSEPPEDHAV